MLIFIVGGAYQGKEQFAKTLGLPVINHLHEHIKRLMEETVDVVHEIMELVGQESCTVICNELGCGIIPAKKEDRDYREMVGRIACMVAQAADVVYKVEAGIALKIKG